MKINHKSIYNLTAQSKYLIVQDNIQINKEILRNKVYLNLMVKI